MITDEQIQNAYLRQYEKGILKKEVRSYEVSVWTLQDDFVTVLKWSDVEQKGRIEHPKMTLSNDNMYEFSFSIPMYYDNGGGILEENPLWYHTQNGNIMINMRKVKVIFNKHTDNEKVFDFMITKITEEHAGDILTAEIKCEELAFHELGKIGYKYSLSLDEYDTDLVSYQTKGYWEMPHGRGHSKPKQNVQYWCSKIGLVQYPANDSYLNPGQWYYKIQMSWQTFPFSTQRLSNIVYEESYACEWDADLKVTRIEFMREKERTVEVSESNIYNITQEIAKQFNIFCRYEYIYDVNYHIIGRVVIFFNNFIHDYDAFSITYPYSSKRISRELDSTDLTTKLYIRTMDDSSTLLGYASICDSPANKIKEDYILNFDYLFETGSLDETYRTFLEEYDKNIYLYNSRLIPLEAEIAAYEDKITELEANITLYTNSIALDTEQINANSALAQELVAKYDNTNTEGTYIDAYNSSHPAIATIIPDANGHYYINLNAQKKGIQVGSLHIYRNYNTSTSTLSNEVSGYSVSYDDYGNPIAIYGISPTSSSARVYLTYEYEPHLYYDAIVKTWKEKLYNDTVALNKNKLELENLDSNGEPQEPYGVKTLLQQAQTSYDRNLAAKNDLIDQLQQIMGPALREGYWQPESYQDYGEQYTKNSSIPNAYNEKFNEAHTGNGIIVGWDTKLFDEEQDISYANGVNEITLPYPSINITDIYSDIKDMQEISSNVCVMFYNGLNREVSESQAFSNIKDIKTFAIGSGAVFTFIKGPNDTVYPALTITGAKGLSDTELNYMRDGGYISIGILTTNIVDSNVYINIGNRINITDDSYWTFGHMSPWTINNNNKYVLNHAFSENYQAAYPRIKFSSLMLKTSSDTLFIRYNNELLEEYEDYYIRNRPYKYYLEDVDQYGYTIETLVTIKPEVLARHALKTGTVQVDYTLSNASTAIYLDALEISKENAYPKVTYTVEPNMLDESIMSTLYDKLNYLVMINDVQLKFKNVFGYISKLDLDLDAPWNDTIEIKNYKNKFEDIFSQIVAQTEQLQRNGSVLDSVARGTYLLSPTSLKSTLTSNNQEMIDYLAENFLTSDAMQDFLSDIFLEVSSILGNSNSAIGETVALTAENSKILGDFAAQIQEELVSRTFRQTARPTDFKAGDIWIEVKLDDQTHEEVEVARYVATSDSNNSMPGYGWTRTHNGSLASLAGPGIDIDPNTGTIQLNADTATIVGNNAVEIGGVQVNIGSTSENPTGYGGVNIVAAAYDSQDFEGVVASKVLINPTKITMFGSEIEMKAGAATDGAIGVTAMTLSGQKGIWLGSNNEIRLFSGTTTLDGKQSSGANIALTPTYLLLGVSSGSSGTAIKMDTSAITLAAGSSTITAIESNGISGVIGNDSSIPRSQTGMRLTKDFFGIAMTNSTSINAIIMNENGITLGSGVGVISDLGGDLTDATGSYVRISGKGIKLNSSATLDVQTANCIINSTATGNTELFRLGGSASPALKYTQNDGLTVSGKINASELNISGQSAAAWLSANMATIGGWTIGSDYIGNAATRNTSTIGMVNASSDSDGVFWAGGAYNGTPNFKVTKQGYVYAKKFVVDGQAIDFTQAFNDAVSIWGSWSGSTLNVYAQFYNNNALKKSVGMNASFSPYISTISEYGGEEGTLCTGNIRIALKIDNKTTDLSYSTGIQINAHKAYIQGWNDCMYSAGLHYNTGTLYTGTDGTYYNGLYIMDQHGAPQRVGEGYICPTTVTFNKKT